MTQLRVSDLVDFHEGDYKLGKNTIVELDKLCNQYSSMMGITNPTDLDELKRKFVAQMSTLTEIYAKVKAFKGANHTYLEDARKQFKSEAFSIVRLGYTEEIDGKEVIHDSVGTTEANTIVYASTYYKERLALMEDIKTFFIRVDEKHQHYTNVIQLIVQTISIVSKDYEYSRYTK